MGQCTRRPDLVVRVVEGVAIGVVGVGVVVGCCTEAAGVAASACGGGTGSGGRLAPIVGWSRWAALSLSIDTVSCLPLRSRVKYFSARAITLYGPS